jgi:ATP-dependent Clp protease ATP-binding subunit ClpA
LRHPFADTGHLLVGVLLTRGSIGSQILQELITDPATAESHLRSLSPSLEHLPPEVRNADELNAALAMAADESTWLGHHYVGTEHLLLGITRTNVGNARALLSFMDISPEQVRRRVRRALSDGARELDLQFAKRNAHLTELSRRVITAAEQMAVSLDHQTVGLGHLLLVLLQEERSPTSALLRAGGLDEAQLRHELQDMPESFVSIEVVLDRALDQAQSMGSHYTGTEHLLLTLAADKDGSALLARFNLSPDDLRHRVKAQLQK